MKKKCLICQKRLAVKVEPFGFLPCQSCRDKMKDVTRPKITGEITTESIKEDRKIFKDMITQPFRDGNLAKEFADAYPEKVRQMIKEGHVTSEEVKKAKDLWDLDYYKRE